MRLISRLLRSFIAHQVTGVRDAIFGLVILTMAVGVLLLAVAFAFLAAFWALSDVFAQWQAALLVAGAALLVAIVLRFIGVHYFKRRGRANNLPLQQEKKLASELLSTTNREYQTADSVTLITLAVLAGIVVGRRMWK